MKINIKQNHRCKSYIKLLLLVLICGAMGNSYGQSNKEVSFYLEGLFSKLDYKVLQNKSEMENGLSLGAEYSYYFSENWSVGTGAELQYAAGSVYLSSLEDAYTTVDSEAEGFEFRYQVENYSEDQYATFLNIPVKLQYETGGMMRFYATLGAKVGFVLQSEYEAEASSLITSGYYEQYDAELSEPQFAGFGDFGAMDTSRSELGLTTNLVINMETGVKFMLENRRALYMGLFIDYGIKDIQPEEKQDNLIVYNTDNPVEFINSSLLSSTSSTTNSQYVDEVKTLAFGLKMQYAFQF